MDRRSFLKIGGSLLLLSACKEEKYPIVKLRNLDFPIQVDSNRNIGHLARKAINEEISSIEKVETLIVGAGIAGLAAANSLLTDDYIVCELDKSIGGTSGAVDINGSWYTQGAHYDLAYPSYYGSESLNLLQKLNIIQLNPKNKAWEFIDHQYLIDEEKEEACYYNGKKRASVLANTDLRSNFLALLNEYQGKFPLPSTLIQKELNHLDQLTFYDYLNKYLPIDNQFIESIDYQMLDDWGGTSRQVSALAGIHYYQCRPYYTGESVQLFSPPQGNYYFIQKMANQLDSHKIKTNHLVFGLKREKNLWKVDVFDHQNSIRKQYIANKVIYAGQKHTLKYIHPESYRQFNDIHYAPWVVINIEMKDCHLADSKWQNDYLSPDNAFLGFVDSAIQTNNKTRVLTAYYCFQNIQHYRVQQLEQDATQLVKETLQKISTYYEQDVSPFVQQVHLKLLGHAMPIPKPNYLTKERQLVKDNLAFAGVDSGRFPLMLDALDSGIQAAKMLYDPSIKQHSI